MLGAHVLQAGVDRGLGEQAARPFDGDDVVAAADDEGWGKFPALSGELGVDLEADGRAGQGTHQLVAQIEDDGEVGLDVGLVGSGRAAPVGAGGAAVVAETGSETGVGGGRSGEYRLRAAGTAEVAAAGLSPGQSVGGVRFPAQVDDPAAVAGVDGEFAPAGQFAARATAA
ncbi:hypothetical protein ACFVYE_43535 [Streptomyces sp. NPDC058239]|uniref:hypothetical protein n=1 Tax=Streptomyces sp. NPDC058239 TaxID=3346395 RepID=UPI0036EB8044